MPIAKKNPIVSVTFSYVGKDSDFETFLKTIVRDYLAVDDPAAAPETDFVQKVESDVACCIPASYSKNYVLWCVLRKHTP